MPVKKRLRVLLVTGSRLIKNKKYVFWCLSQHPCEIMIFGDAPGVDTLCWEFCMRQGIEHRIFKAKWDQFGRSAGVLRNKEMVEILWDKHDGGIGIWEGSSKGTLDAIRRLKKAQRLMHVYRYDQTLMHFLKK